MYLHMHVHMYIRMCVHVHKIMCVMGVYECEMCTYVIVVTWARAAGLRAEGIHIRRIISAYVSSNMDYFSTLKICPNLQASALPIYITMSIHFDYRIFKQRFHNIYLFNAM